MSEGRKQRPAINQDARENQLVGLAIDLAEQQLRSGTASSQVITHYLKIGSTRERLEKEMLEKQNRLIDAKTESYNSGKKMEEMYRGALEAMRNYSSRTGDYDDEEEY